MKFPRKTSACLLGVVGLVTLLFRYPGDFGHEAGSDTTFIHSLVDSLIANGHALWILSPYSYLGLYALSYPSAIPFLLTSISLLSGLPVEAVILLNGLVFAIVGTMSAFLAGRAAKEDDRLAFLVALLFTIAPLFVQDTTWIGSTRGFVTALVPALFLLLLRHMRQHDTRALFLFAVLVLTVTAIHRMGSLSIFVLIAYLFALPFHSVTQKLRFILLKYDRSFRIGSVTVAGTAFVSLFYVQFLFPGIGGGNIDTEYGSGAFFSGSSFPILMLNLVVSLGGKVGLLLPLAVVGLFKVTWKRPKEDRDKFLLVAVLVIIPLLSFRDYITEFLIFLFVLFIALALIPRPRGRSQIPKRKVLALATVALLLTGAVAFSWVMKDYWRNRYYTDGPIPDSLYGSSVYVLWQTDGTILSNEGLTAGRLTSITGRPVMPIGGASIHWYGPQQLTFAFVNGSNIRVQLIPLSSISFKVDEIFVPQNVPNAKDDYEKIFYNSLNDPVVRTLLTRYEIHYVLLDNKHLADFQSYAWRYSPLVVDIGSDRYMTYDSPTHSVWFLG